MGDVIEFPKVDVFTDHKKCLETLIQVSRTLWKIEGVTQAALEQRHSAEKLRTALRAIQNYAKAVDFVLLP